MSAAQKNGDPSPYTGNPADSLGVIVQNELALAVQAHPMEGDTISHISMVGSNLGAFVSDKLLEIGQVSNDEVSLSSLQIFIEDISVEANMNSYLALIQLLETIVVDFPELDDNSREKVLQTIALLKHVRFEFDKYIFDHIGIDRASPLANCMSSQWNSCMDDWINSFTGPFAAIVDIIAFGAHIASADCLIQAYSHCREQLSK